ncbi:hypothetical protein [Saccharopolyspora taberi]|uniref:Uncharacterized protein n=1 Tax=Saccharopolyspora taberi TaxID=60895 RepID=A0ABN3V0G5_9PSEU
MAFAIPQYQSAQATLESTRNQSERLGGIYALERIARYSPPDHPSVVNVLATFARETSRTLTFFDFRGVRFSGTPISAAKLDYTIFTASALTDTGLIISNLVAKGATVIGR